VWPIQNLQLSIGCHGNQPNGNWHSGIQHDGLNCDIQRNQLNIASLIVTFSKKDTHHYAMLIETVLSVIRQSAVIPSVISLSIMARQFCENEAFGYCAFGTIGVIVVTFSTFFKVYFQTLLSK
jgi:hypothetical protein